MQKRIKFNLGCGNIRPEGWTNLDSSINSAIQKYQLGKLISKMYNLNKYSEGISGYINLNKPWKYKDESIDVVYGSHVFEHLKLKSAKMLLRESYRTLKAGGAIRLVVPDLYKHAKSYVHDFEQGNSDSAQRFLYTLNLHLEGQYPPEKKMHRLWGWIQGWPHQHKYMYDKFTLSNLLAEFEFRDIKENIYGESFYIQEIKEVESNNKETYKNSIYLEAQKPY